ncbi:MAG: cation diffusion facilitator family transporter [Coleofasciculus sp. S288]|nr:cation diffusion facilitator family transporter [Coleofasciculus sp. S288]
MTAGQKRDRAGRLILFTTLWLMLFILSVKVSAAWAARSLSLMAESLHTLLVSFSTLLSLLRINPSNLPASPVVYGHGKRETIITFLLVAFLGSAGLNLLVLSAQQLTVATLGAMLMFSARVSVPLIQLLGLVILTSMGLALLGLHQGRILGNPALRFNAGQLLKDVCLTLIVLIGLLGVAWGWVWLDLVLAILLVLLAVASCWQIVKWQLPFLVQQTAIAPEAIAQIVRQVVGVTHCYQIQSRGIVGRFVYIQMHLVIHPEFTGFRSLIAERIRGEIQERFGPVQITFYINDATEMTPFNDPALKPEFNGQNDKIGENEN